MDEFYPELRVHLERPPETVDCAAGRTLDCSNCVASPQSRSPTGRNAFTATGFNKQDKVKVYVRMRPFSDSEKVCPLKHVLCLLGETIVVRDLDQKLTGISKEPPHKADTIEFKVDYMQDDSYLQVHSATHKEESQKRMYGALGVPCIESALDGYNTTILAYGQTGSGKTYTMMGDNSRAGRGLIPRLANDLMAKIHEESSNGVLYTVQVSYLEIYQEKIRDLLAEDDVEEESKPQAVPQPSSDPNGMNSHEKVHAPGSKPEVKVRVPGHNVEDKVRKFEERVISSYAGSLTENSYTSSFLNKAALQRQLEASQKHIKIKSEVEKSPPEKPQSSSGHDGASNKVRSPKTKPAFDTVFSKQKVHKHYRTFPTVMEEAAPVRKQHFLKIREHPITGPFVEGLLWKDVSNWYDMESLMQQGSTTRTTAATDMNELSSRSHAVFSIRLTKKLGPDLFGVQPTSMNYINLVDLAGSEKLPKLCLGAVTGQRTQEESKCINRSLSQLNEVILSLTKSSFVSYRNSVLTWLLKESLGGNSRTFMVANISPTEKDLRESINTLRYATTASRIPPPSSSDQDPRNKLIKKLKEEICTLRNLLSSFTSVKENAPSDQLPSLQGFKVPCLDVGLQVEENCSPKGGGPGKGLHDLLDEGCQTENHFRDFGQQTISRSGSVDAGFQTAVTDRAALDMGNPTALQDSGRVDIGHQTLILNVCACDFGHQASAQDFGVLEVTVSQHSTPSDCVANESCLQIIPQGCGSIYLAEHTPLRDCGAVNVGNQTGLSDYGFQDVRNHLPMQGWVDIHAWNETAFPDEGIHDRIPVTPKHKRDADAGNEIRVRDREDGDATNHITMQTCRETTVGNPSSLRNWGAVDAGNQIMSLNPGPVDAGNQITSPNLAPVDAGNQISPLNLGPVDAGNHTTVRGWGNVDAGDQVTPRNPGPVDAGNQITMRGWGNVDAGNQIAVRGWGDVDAGNHIIPGNSRPVDAGNQIAVRGWGNVDAGNQIIPQNWERDDAGNQITSLNSGPVDTGNQIASLNSGPVDAGNHISPRNWERVDAGNQITVRGWGDLDAGHQTTPRNWGSVDAGNQITPQNWERVDAGNQTTVRGWGDVDAGNQITPRNWQPVDTGNQITVRDWGNVDAGNQIKVRDWGNVDAGNQITPRNWQPVDTGNQITVRDWGNVDAGNQIKVRDWGNVDAGNQIKVRGWGDVDAGNQIKVRGWGDVDAGHQITSRNWGDVDVGHQITLRNWGDVNAQSQISLRDWGYVDVGLQASCRDLGAVDVGNQISLRDWGVSDAAHQTNPATRDSGYQVSWVDFAASDNGDQICWRDFGSSDVGHQVTADGRGDDAHQPNNSKDYKVVDDELRDDSRGFKGFTLFDFGQQVSCAEFCDIGVAHHVNRNDDNQEIVPDQQFHSESDVSFKAQHHTRDFLNDSVLWAQMTLGRSDASNQVDWKGTGPVGRTTRQTVDRGSDAGHEIEPKDLSTTHIELQTAHKGDLTLGTDNSHTILQSCSAENVWQQTAGHKLKKTGQRLSLPVSTTHGHTALINSKETSGRDTVNPNIPTDVGAFVTSEEEGLRVGRVETIKELFERRSSGPVQFGHQRSPWGSKPASPRGARAVSVGHQTSLRVEDGEEKESQTDWQYFPAEGVYTPSLLEDCNRPTILELQTNFDAAHQTNWDGTGVKASHLSRVEFGCQAAFEDYLSTLRHKSSSTDFGSLEIDGNGSDKYRAVEDFGCQAAFEEYLSTLRHKSTSVGFGSLEVDGNGSDKCSSAVGAWNCFQCGVCGATPGNSMVVVSTMVPIAEVAADVALQTSWMDCCELRTPTTTTTSWGVSSDLYPMTLTALESVDEGHQLDWEELQQWDPFGASDFRRQALSKAAQFLDLEELQMGPHCHQLDWEDCQGSNSLSPNCEPNWMQQNHEIMLSEPTYLLSESDADTFTTHHEESLSWNASWGSRRQTPHIIYLDDLRGLQDSMQDAKLDEISPNNTDCLPIDPDVQARDFPTGHGEQQEPLECIIRSIEERVSAENEALENGDDDDDATGAILQTQTIQKDGSGAYSSIQQTHRDSVCVSWLRDITGGAEKSGRAPAEEAFHLCSLWTLAKLRSRMECYTIHSQRDCFKYRFSLSTKCRGLLSQSPLFSKSEAATQTDSSPSPEDPSPHPKFHLSDTLQQICLLFVFVILRIATPENEKGSLPNSGKRHVGRKSAVGPKKKVRVLASLSDSALNEKRFLSRRELYRPPKLRHLRYSGVEPLTFKSTTPFFIQTSGNCSLMRTVDDQSNPRRSGNTAEGSRCYKIMCGFPSRRAVHFLKEGVNRLGSNRGGQIVVNGFSEDHSEYIYMPARRCVQRKGYVVARLVAPGAMAFLNGLPMLEHKELCTGDVLVLRDLGYPSSVCTLHFFDLVKLS